MQSGYVPLLGKNDSEADGGDDDVSSVAGGHEEGPAVMLETHQELPAFIAPGGDQQQQQPREITESEHDYDSLWDGVASELRSPREVDEAHSLIDVLSNELLQREVPEYLDAFEVVVPDAEVVVGAVPLEEVQQREQQLEEARLRQAELEGSLYRQRELHLARQEALARARLLQEAQRKHAELALKDRQAAEAAQLRARRIGHVFQQAETHLHDVLKRQEAKVEQVYGALEPSRVPQSRKRYRVEWSQIPLTVRVRAKMLSAVKDKLPPGQYVLVATLYDRLGGHALHWTAWDPELPPNAKAAGRGSSAPTRVKRPNFTRPFQHRGRFYNTELVVNQDVYVVCPPESALRPGNVLIFELFLLSPATVAAHAGVAEPRKRRRRGGLSLERLAARQTDHVVAWGALPLSSPDFQVVQGKFKLPLLRGEMDATMDKYIDMERMYQQDLSSWLCNLYIQVRHLPTSPAVLHRVSRTGPNQDEAYDAEVDERGGLVRLLEPETENNHQRYMRAMSVAPDGAAAVRRRLQPLPGKTLEDVVEVTGVSADTTKQSKPGVVRPFSSSATQLLDDEDAAPYRTKSSKKAVRHHGVSVWSTTWRRWRRWLSPASFSKKTRVYSGDILATQRTQQQDKRGNGEASDAGDELGSPLQDQQADEHWDELSDYSDGIDEDEDEDDVALNGQPRRLDVENYTFSVNTAVSMETARHQRFHAQRKLHYLRHELLADLGFSNAHTLEFWRLAALLALACWLRIYVHYVTQWLFLRGNRVPVYDFQPRWTTCVVKYTWQTVPIRTELGVLALGVLGNTALFGFLAAAAAVGQHFVGDLPAFGSNFVVCAGLATVLDPLLVLLVDVMSHHYGCSQLPECASLAATECSCVDGDWFKLYVRFQAQEGSGVVGIFVVLMLYVALTCVSLVALYAYLLYIHMNGRMLDVYRRVHAQEDSFFVPHDAEISLQELQAVCAQATRWKGPRGTQRKVFVHEYALSDPLDPLFRETNVHVAVYNVELNGARELHRHFLKTSDGAVLELFGELGASADGAWQSDAPQGAASLALLYSILQDVHADDGGSEGGPEAGVIGGLFNDL